MLNSLKVFSRNFAKQRTVGILSVGGLAVAIAVVLLVGLWAVNELRFDNFHKDGDKIYRLGVSIYLNNAPAKIGSTFKPFGEEAKAKLPEIEEMCRVMAWTSDEVTIDDVLYGQNQVYVADTNFFTFFTFPLKVGDAATVFAAPDNMVVSETFVRKYFPNDNPMGEVVQYEGKDWKITGIMQDMPSNSHLKADVIVPFYGYYAKDKWGGSDVYMTYFKLDEQTNNTALLNGLNEILYQGMPDFKKLHGMCLLLPLKDIHFATDYGNESCVKGNESLVLIFLITALVVLLIAVINFVNLFISTSFIRAKSIGVKKSHGADKMQLVKEFYLETFYYVLVSVGIGLGIAIVCLPFFNQLADSDIRIALDSPLLYLFLAGVLGFTVLISGLFPSLYMTKFGVVETLRGQFRGKNLSALQKGLIITQFTASVIFLISVFFINKQVHFMVDKDLGFEKENVAYMYGRDGLAEHYETVREELLKCASVVDVTGKRGLPTQWLQGWQVKKQGSADGCVMEMCRVRDNYFGVLGMKIVDGENPFREMHDSLNYCVINETAARLLGMKHPVGENLDINKRIYSVKGVVRDAQTKSLHQSVDAQVYLKLRRDDSYAYDCSYLVKIAGDSQLAIKAMEKQWKQWVPKAPFEYGFLNQVYENLYKVETNAGRILTTAMLVTILISVVGLFAMAFYSTQRRIKEIGVRKVNGASVGEILVRLNRDFLKWVGISFLIACPISYLLVYNWLEEFQARTVISWWVFALVGVLVFVVAILTVSYQTWKAANINPVKALKNE